MESRIATYYSEIQEHQKNIRDIQSDSRYDKFDKNCIAAVKIESQGIRDLRVAIHDLLKNQATAFSNVKAYEK